jgi:glycosyltransferase involved in cell wall biosynthesis
MRIAFVCPTFPPDNCGVGDHSFFFSRELASQGEQIRIWTRQRSWSPKVLCGIAEEIERWGADLVVIQYTPHLFAPASRGVNPFVPLWILRLKKARLQVVVIAHELNYPAELTLRGVLLGIPQLLQFLAIAALADRVFFTYEAAMKKTSRRLPWRKKAFDCLSVGSNIELQSQNMPQENSMGDAEPRTRILLHFGGMHPTHLFGHMLSALEICQRKCEFPMTLVCIGVSHDQVIRKAQELGYSKLQSAIQGLGYLSASEVSLWLQRCDLVLAPFMDGVSTRRGSFMAAISHGCPVITTRGWATSDQIPWEKFCLLAPADSPERFSEMVLGALSSPQELVRLGEHAKDYAEKMFSWKQIAQDFSRALAR